MNVPYHMDHNKRANELREAIKKAREAYYNLTPEIDDSVYDALVDELRTLDPTALEVSAVGARPPKYSVWEKVKHEIPMGSLDKINSDEEWLEWSKRILRLVDSKEEFLITHKIDGSSLEVIYNNGELIRCVTRGDGITGEDITTNAIQIPNLPNSIPIKHERVIVRGEVVMLKNVFEEHYSSQYANPRNTAAGKIRDKKGGGSDCKNLSFLAFTLMSETAPPKESLRFKILEKMGFQVPNWKIGDSEEITKEYSMISEGRKEIPYEIDGVVIRIEDIASQEELGDRNMRPLGQIAWKFDPAMGITKVLDVKWQVGPTGRICPVAKVEPVNIGGVTITSISLHNLAMFKELALCEGDEVLVSRRNDVIPYIEQKVS